MGSVMGVVVCAVMVGDVVVVVDVYGKYNTCMNNLLCIMETKFSAK